jgi:pyruvate formate lyase activating enzyme
MDSIELKGKITQFQSMGTLDGPGLRYVVFMQGCPLRCVYCHNPETWAAEGTSYSVKDVADRIIRCKAYISQGGGATFSGGEPLLQWRFVKEVFQRLRAEGIHTALDTSGIGDLTGAAELLSVTDLVLCDLKFSNEADYKKYTTGDMGEVLEFLRLTQKSKVPLWIRHVVVPGLTDNLPNIEKIGEIARGFSNLEKIELLPFKKLCIAKYEALGISFPLAHTRECGKEKIKQLQSML